MKKIMTILVGLILLTCLSADAHHYLGQSADPETYESLEKNQEQNCVVHLRLTAEGLVAGVSMRGVGVEISPSGASKQKTQTTLVTAISRSLLETNPETGAGSIMGEGQFARYELNEDQTLNYMLIENHNSGKVKKSLCRNLMLINMD